METSVVNAWRLAAGGRHRWLAVMTLVLVKNHCSLSYLSMTHTSIKRAQGTGTAGKQCYPGPSWLCDDA